MEWLKEGRAWMERWRERGTQSDERSDRGREREKRNLLGSLNFLDYIFYKICDT